MPKIFGNFAIFSRELGAKSTCQIATLDVGLFSDMNAMLTRSTLSDVVRYSQLTIDECTQFFVRGACYRGRWVELQKVISSEGSLLKKVH